MGATAAKERASAGGSQIAVQLPAGAGQRTAQAAQTIANARLIAFIDPVLADREGLKDERCVSERRRTTCARRGPVAAVAPQTIRDATATAEPSRGRGAERSRAADARSGAGREHSRERRGEQPRISPPQQLIAADARGTHDLAGEAGLRRRHRLLSWCLAFIPLVKQWRGAHRDQLLLRMHRR